DREAWHEIPELDGICGVRARDAYYHARSRAWRSPKTWLALGMLVAGYVGLIFLAPHSLGALGPGPAYQCVRVALISALGGLAIGRFFAYRRALLRRYVRGALGTHCARCDYDLMGTPDPPRPTIAR